MWFRTAVTAFLFGLLFFAFAIGVALRRLVRGPRRPGWNWRQESTIRYMRWIGDRLLQRGVPELKAHIERLPTPLGTLRSKVDLDPVSADGVPAEWIVPRGAPPVGRVIYYLHGGGYVLCSVATHRHLIARLALRADARALAVNYRLGPEHPFPAAVEDAVAGYRWLVRHCPPERIVLAGDSAGGGLSLATLLQLKQDGDIMPAGAVLISPWVDLAAEDDESLTENTEYDYLGSPQFLRRTAEAYLGDADPTDPLASPVYADLHGLPPLLIQVGGVEILHDQSVRLAQRAEEAGVEVDLQQWPEMVHVWHAFGHLFRRQASEAVSSIAEFIRRRAHVSGGSSPRDTAG